MPEYVTVSLMTAAIAGLLIYAIAWLCDLTTRLWLRWRSAPFEHMLTHEPAALYRQRQAVLRSAKRRALLSVTGAFGAACATALTQSTRLFNGSQPSLVVTVVSALWLALMIAYLVALSRQTGALRHPIAASSLIAQHLHGISGEFNRVFHDVSATDGSWIDHVLVGVQGAFAVVVLAVPTRKSGIARRRGDTLMFGPAGPRADLARARERVSKLQHTLSKSLGKMIRLRLVVAMPGWRCEGDCGDDMLIVGGRDVVMLQGWRDASDALLTEEALSLHNTLAALSTPQGPPQARAIARQSLLTGAGARQRSSLRDKAIGDRPQVSG